jgi:hypothetical protein
MSEQKRFIEPIYEVLPMSTNLEDFAEIQKNLVERICSQFGIPKQLLEGTHYANPFFPKTNATAFLRPAFFQEE